MRLTRQYRVAAVLPSVFIVAAFVWLSVGIATVARQAIAVRVEASSIMNSAASGPEISQLPTGRLASAASRLRVATENPRWRLVTAAPGLGPIASLISELAIDLNEASRNLDQAVESTLSRGAGETLDPDRSLPAAADGFEAAGEHAHELAGKPVLRPLARSLRQLADGSGQLASQLRGASLGSSG